MMKLEASRSTGSAKQRLVAELLPRVDQIARALSRRLPSHVDRSDVIAAGRLGLAEALSKVGSTPAPSFTGYALQRTRGSIVDEFRAKDLLTRTERRAVRKLDRAEMRLSAGLGRAPTLTELSESTSMTERDCAAAQLAAGRRVLSQTHTDDESVECGPPDDDSPETLLSRRRELEQVERGRASLPERLRIVLELYYDQDLTLREIGGQLGISEARVSQLRQVALTELRGRTRAA